MKILKTVFTLFVSVILFTSCGGESKKEKNQEKNEANTNLTSDNNKPEKDDNLSRVVITANDAMKFNKEEVYVKAGTRVKLILRHIGKMDVNIMGHNVVILKKGVDVADFAARAATEKENDYLPEGTQDVIAHTKMIGGGQITTVEFDAPSVGTYDFICSFPAHYALMNGKFIVE